MTALHSYEIVNCYTQTGEEDPVFVDQKVRQIRSDGRPNRFVPATFTNTDVLNENEGHTDLQLWLDSNEIGVCETDYVVFTPAKLTNEDHRAREYAERCDPITIRIQGYEKELEVKKGTYTQDDIDAVQDKIDALLVVFENERDAILTAYPRT